ncbi:MAG: ABC-2 type transport system ATP-binding protein [Candidatus Azotimanducaceae bacterium]|jgi:ABC-2 type transport system ATP-binding protein
MSHIVKATHLRKSYGNFEAIRDVTFTIEPGSIVGLIGPNGAGKTTTLKSILGLTSFEGELDVLGVDPRHGRHHIMDRVCFIADVGVLPRWLKVKNAIDYIEGIHPRFSRAKAEELIRATDIRMDSKVSQLSKGMVTQLHLALILAIDVELLVLDEPTIGLDILYRKEFYDRLLNDYFDHETSIVISTHQVEEIESLLSHLLFINRGEIVLDCAMDDLSDQYRQVLVNPEHVEKALSLGPLISRELLGKKSMIFENADVEVLKHLGELHVPSVTDLFVAKMQRGAA